MDYAKEKNLNWIPALEWLGIMAVFLATTITLFVHSDNNQKKSEDRLSILIENMRTDTSKNLEALRIESTKCIESMRQDILAFHKENAEMMRDFHGRLCAIEEKNKR